MLKIEVEQLQKELFSGAGRETYAVLDGAAISVLREQLYELEPPHCCLYPGELEPDMAEVAPYLVQLEPDTLFTEWLLREGWGNSWGIFARSDVGLREMRSHFRSFIMVEAPKGETLLFRFYDPRIFRVYLSTCNREERAFVFGPIAHYLLENGQAELMLFEEGND